MGCIARSAAQVSAKRGTVLLLGIAAAASAALFTPVFARAQTLLPAASSGRVNMFSADNAVLDEKEPRKDIPCNVTPEKPILGFDMKFHAGYEVSVPMRELNGGDDLLTIIFRVTPSARPDQASYFTERVTVPKLDERAGGEAYLEGSFIVGEGEYQIDWLMRDRAERLCSSYWTSNAVLSSREKPIQLSIQPDTVEPTDPEPFREETAVARRDSNGISVKILINFAPQHFLASAMGPLDTAALVSILRSISRDSRVGKFSLVAFNVQDQRIIYRQDESDQIDFPALGESLSSIKLGTVDVSHLNQKHSDTDFLTQLITNEMSHDRPDALIFAGPKVMMEEGVPADSVKALSEDVSYPVFYMNYNSTPQANPWRDVIGAVVKRLKGYEYTISRPHDLWSAWSDIMSHVVRLRVARAAPMPAASQ